MAFSKSTTNRVCGTVVGDNFSFTQLNPTFFIQETRSCRSVDLETHSLVRRRRIENDRAMNLGFQSTPKGLQSPGKLGPLDNRSNLTSLITSYLSNARTYLLLLGNAAHNHRFLQIAYLLLGTNNLQGDTGRSQTVEITAVQYATGFQ